MPLTLADRAEGILLYLKQIWWIPSDKEQPFLDHCISVLQDTWDAAQADVIPPIPGPMPYAMCIIDPRGQLADSNEVVMPNFVCNIAGSPTGVTGKATLYDWGTGQQASQDKIFTLVNGVASVTDFRTLANNPMPAGHYKLVVTFSDGQYGNWIELIVESNDPPVVEPDPIP